MEKLAQKLANNVATKLQYDEEKEAVIAYGLTAIFQMFVIAAVVSIVGILFDFWIEAILIFLAVGIIRKSTGGAHSQKMIGCLIISIGSICLLSALSRYVLSMQLDTYLNLSISALLFMFCFFVFYRRVPVDSPRKPIKNPVKIKRLRKQSYVLLVVILLLSVLFIFFAPYWPRLYSILFSLRLALLWQLFTLTKAGAGFVNFVDKRI